MLDAERKSSRTDLVRSIVRVVAWRRESLVSPWSGEPVSSCAFHCRDALLLTYELLSVLHSTLPAQRSCRAASPSPFATPAAFTHACG